MMRHGGSAAVGSAYCRRHVLDHAHQAPRSGPLPRALGAVSNVLTVPPASEHLSPSDYWTTLVGGTRAGPCRRARLVLRRPPQERHVHHCNASHHHARCRQPPAGAIDPRGPQFAAGLTAVVLVAVLLLPPARSTSSCSPSRRCCSPSARCAACSARRTPGSSARSSGRGWRRPTELEDAGAAAVRPGRRPGLRAGRPRRASCPARPLVGQVAVGVRARRRPAQRRLRLLPGLRGLPARPPRHRLTRTATRHHDCSPPTRSTPP